MDVGAPQWRKEIPVGETQQQIAKAGRIENVCVKQRLQANHRLLQTEFLVASSQFIECLMAARFCFSAELKNVLNADAPV